MAKEPTRTDSRSTLFIGSVEKTFQVIESFGKSQRVMSIAELARAADLDRSATQRIVHTLTELGYLVRVENRRGYALSSKVLQFSSSYLSSNELVVKAAPYLFDISRSIEETVNLQELDGADIVFLSRYPGRRLINIDVVVGAKRPAFFTASGTAILSRLPLEARKAILEKTTLKAYTPFTELNPDALLQRVATAAEKGYAVVANETAVGDISVGAPIVDEKGYPLAAVTISVPTTHWTVERAEAELAQHAQIACTMISRAR